MKSPTEALWGPIAEELLVPLAEPEALLAEVLWELLVEALEGFPAEVPLEVLVEVLEGLLAEVLWEAPVEALEVLLAEVLWEALAEVPEELLAEVLEELLAEVLEELLAEALAELLVEVLEVQLAAKHLRQHSSVHRLDFLQLLPKYSSVLQPHHQLHRQGYLLLEQRRLEPHQLVAKHLR